jgi:glycosyltransferase involved in cell wall biosynthesis
MNNLSTKPKILVFIPNYLPGYKSGGILRTVVNTVNWLNSDYEFWIVTRDRDLGSDEPYQEILTNEWQYVEGAMVLYLPPELITIHKLTKLIATTSHDLIHLNSFFDSVFTIKVLLARRMGCLSRKPLILSPRGEFVEGPLKLKYTKKITYIYLSKLLGFYKNVIWHASSKYELQDFVKVMKVNVGDAHVALDLPSKVNVDTANSTLLTESALRVVFLSRLTREKNLDYALRILKSVKSKIIFDIYGPDEDSLYWRECEAYMTQLPDNVTVSYHGSVTPSEVAEIFNCYDLFFFPSRGENYGHVIAEAISVGTKVLISKNTPWLDLDVDGLGWDVDLRDENVFIEIIDEMASERLDVRLEKRVVVKQSALRRLMDPKVLNDNRELYRTAT